MQSMLFAEAAVLVHLETVGIVLLVLHRIVVSLLALRAGQRYLNAHNGTSLNCVCARRPVRPVGVIASLCRLDREKSGIKKRTYIGVIIVSRLHVQVKHHFLSFVYKSGGHCAIMIAQNR